MALNSLLPRVLIIPWQKWKIPMTGYLTISNEIISKPVRLELTSKNTDWDNFWYEVHSKINLCVNHKSPTEIDSTIKNHTCQPQQLMQQHFLTLKKISLSYLVAIRKAIVPTYHVEACSDYRSISVRVPQGNVLRPFLYLSYTSDISENPGTHVFTFTYNTAILDFHEDYYRVITTFKAAIQDFISVD